MKYYPFLLALFLLPILASAQPTFYRSLDYDGDLTWGMQVAKIDAGYTIFGLENCGGKGCVTWLETDAEGMLTARFYLTDTLQSITGTNRGPYVKIGNQHFITTTLSNTDETIDLAISKIDPTTREVIWNLKIDDGLENFPTRLLESDDGNLMAYHAKILSVSPYLSITNLIKLNTIGEVIWQTSIGIGEEINYAFNHLALDSGEHLVFSAACELDADCQDFLIGYGLYATKVDESGNELWSRELRRGLETRWHGTDPVLLDDGLVALNWIHDTFPLPAGEVRFQDMLIWMDQEGEIVNEFFFPRDRERNIRSMTKAANGDIIGAGSVDVSDLELGRGGYVFRMAPDGTLLWERYLADVRFPSDNHFFNDVIEADDGGIVLTGLIRDSFPNNEPYDYNPNVWLVKLDSLGCLEPGCTRFQVMGATVDTEEAAPPERPSPLRIYPNPTATFAHLQWPATEEVAYPLEVEVFDLAGRAVLRRTFAQAPAVLQCSAWSAGYYVVRVRDRDGRQWGSRLVVG